MDNKNSINKKITKKVVKSKLKSKTSKLIKKNKTSNEICFDFIIIGSGISGLYTAYNILKRNKNCKVLICEKNDRFGGRIETINYKGETYEAGAARFNDKQIKILSLIKELGLNTKLYPIKNTKNTIFYPKNKFPILSKKYPTFNDIILSIKKLNLSDDILIKHNLLSFVDKYLNKNNNNENIKKYTEEKYQYYSEIAHLNAKDALKLFKKDLNNKRQYYILNGGLSQIINKLVNYIKNNGGIIKKNTIIEEIVETHNECYKFLINDKYISKNLICAVPKHSLKNLKIFKPINNLLNKVVCEPLYRIYAKYPVKNGKCWFSDLPKYGTNLPIKFFIPYNYSTGFIMITYTDSKYANYWLKYIDSEDKFLNKLNYNLKKMFPDRDIPNPEWIKHHYWRHGAAYWKVNSKSEDLINKIVKPFKDKNIFICGENYSNHQAWMEGALQTSDLVLNKIF